MTKPWRIVYAVSVKNTLKALIDKGLISEDDFDIILMWIKQVEQHGPSSLRKTHRMDDFHPMRLTKEILNRVESEINLWNDHDLHGKWQGYRSSSFSRMGRIIYKVEQGCLRIVHIQRITATHDYKR